MITEFRDRETAKKACDRIKEIAKNLDHAKIMHVCGTHEDTITRYGIRSLLPENVEVISGPGCPVCVTTGREIDEAIALADKGLTVTTFGDMLKVPGSENSLEGVKAKGGDVRVVYSITDATRIAAENPDTDVVHIAIGFETTAPSTAAELKTAPGNFSVLCCHRTIPNAMDLLLSSGDVKVNGFIDPGHVSAIIGLGPYRPLTEKFNVPQVIAGFEPLDVLFGILLILEMMENGKAEVKNEYSRVVKDEGNPRALEIMNEVFQPCDVRWRGFPIIPGSGLELKEEFSQYDARKKFNIKVEDRGEPAGCRCGDILKGLIRPDECPIFGKGCAPDKPVGPCMVSSEGACAIAYKFNKNA